MMPRFFEDMPEDQPGIWIACVVRNYSFAGRKEVWRREVVGLRRAYVLARLMALWEDFWCPYHDGEVGIEWAIKQRVSDQSKFGLTTSPR